MRVRFNEGSKLVDYIKFPNVKISISNTPEELEQYCKGNIYLKSVEGGTITSHYGKCMFAYATNLKTFTTQLNGIMSAESMFEGCASLSSITTDCKQLVTASANQSFSNPKTGSGMFKDCVNLKEADLGALERLSNATMMFCSCKSLKAFTGALNSLIYAEGMFYGCESLDSVELGDLTNLEYSRSMFSKTAIKSFSADTIKIKCPQYMFSNCSGLTSCKTVLNTAEDLTGIFKGCTSLRTLSVGELSADIDLKDCPLTLKSITEIANGAVDGNHKIGISEYTKGLSGFNKVKSTLESKGWVIF